MKKLRGFTLIELLVVVLIVAILAMVALPSYQEHIRKTRRTQAKADMVEITQMMEREFTLNRSYANFPVEDYDQSPLTGTPYYRLSFAPEPLDNTYTITATPIGPQEQDTRCDVLTLNHLGTKTANGTDGVKGCW